MFLKLAVPITCALLGAGFAAVTLREAEPARPTVAQGTALTTPGPVSRVDPTTIESLQFDVAMLGEVVRTLIERVDAQQGASSESAPFRPESARAADDTAHSDNELDMTVVVGEAEEEAQRVREERAMLRERVASDVRDVAFASEASSSITGALNDLGIEGAHIETTECGVELCLLEFAFDAREGLEATVVRLPLLLPTEGGTYWYVDESDPTRLTVFAEREEIRSPGDG